MRSAASRHHAAHLRRAERARLEPVAVRWQRALDAADAALHDAYGAVPDAGRRATALAAERQVTAGELAALAHDLGVAPAPWLAPGRVTPQLLGLEAGTRACVFDLEGVLTYSGLMHAAIWGELFDDLLLRLSEETGWQFVPFDRAEDYRRYVDGRSRREGIRTFLESRGIHLPPEAEAALAQKKGMRVEQRLRSSGLAPRPDARRYLEAAARAGLPCAVVSESENAFRMLVLSRLAPLLAAVVDASTLEREGLATRPAPDLYRAAANRLGVDAAACTAFTHSPAGVAAARAAGMTVVGVGGGELLAGFGADRSAPALGPLLDRSLAA